MSGMIGNRTYILDRSADTAHLKVPLFSMRGVDASPRMAVTAPEALARSLSDRLWDLPAIGRIRGSLVIRADDQDPAYDRPDVVVRLTTQNETDAYYQVLGRMAEFGMISGCGAPLKTAA